VKYFLLWWGSKVSQTAQMLAAVAERLLCVLVTFHWFVPEEVVELPIISVHAEAIEMVWTQQSQLPELLLVTDLWLEELMVTAEVQVQGPVVVAVDFTLMELPVPALPTTTEKHM
jgi:hypothetical protein